MIGDCFNFLIHRRDLVIQQALFYNIFYAGNFFYFPKALLNPVKNSVTS
jgi:hypothetical protein